MTKSVSGQAKTLLFVAGSLSVMASLIHIAIIIGGAEWYRFFGAGEQMARLAESGSPYPALVTTGIAAILLVWGLYAYSAAGLLLKLPFIRFVLSLVTFIYLARGLAGITLPFVSQHPIILQQSLSFWLISSTICIAFGLTYLAGLIRYQQSLGLPSSQMNVQRPDE